MNKKKVALVLKWTFLIIVLALIYMPILFIIAYSFSSQKDLDVNSDFGKFTFGLYTTLFQNAELMSALKNTVIIGVSSALIATFLGTFTAVGLYYMRRGKKTVNFISQITVVNAEVVTAVGFYLLFILLNRFMTVYSLGWLILAHSIITTPYVILTVSPRLNQLNPNLYEAGLDLGAGPMRSLFTVIIPQLVGGMVSGFALAFTLSLDDFVLTNLNKGFGSGVETISTYVYSRFRRKLTPAIRALSTIIFLVVLIILIIFNIVKNKKERERKKANTALVK